MGAFNAREEFVKEIQVVIQWRRFTSGHLSGVEAIHEIECRDLNDVLSYNKIYTVEKPVRGYPYQVIATQLINRSVPDDYIISFSID